jgi:hypothetical protein
MSKRNVSEIESGAGYFMGLITTLMNVARQKGVPFGAIYRLGTEGGYATVVKIADVAYADWRAEQLKPVVRIKPTQQTKFAEPQGDHERLLTVCKDEKPKAECPLGEDEHLVRVDYNMPSEQWVLEIEFSRGGVSALFWKDLVWVNHSSCAGIDQSPGDRVVLVKHFDRLIPSEEAIAEMDKLGYRPATHLEMYALSKANPRLQRQFRIVALGSYVKFEGVYFVAMLSNRFEGRNLDTKPFGSEWSNRTRFLFVRKNG